MGGSSSKCGDKKYNPKLEYCSSKSGIHKKINNKTTPCGSDLMCQSGYCNKKAMPKDINSGRCHQLKGGSNILLSLFTNN